MCALDALAIVAAQLKREPLDSVMLIGLLIAMVEGIGGLILWGASRAIAGITRCTRKTAPFVRFPTMILAYAALLAAVLWPLFVPLLWFPELAPSSAYATSWLLFCYAVLVFLPYLWYSKYHPDWAADPLPDWARGRPTAVFRAPWYNNWGGSIYVGCMFLGAIPFVAMGHHGKSLPEALWLGVQAGALGAVGFFPLLAWFTFIFPVRLYPAGIRGFDREGFPVSARWSTMMDATLRSSFGTDGYEVALAEADTRLLIPKSVVSQPAFRRAVTQFVRDDHVMVRLLGRRSDVEQAGSRPPGSAV